MGIIYLTRTDGGLVELGDPVEAEGGSFGEPIPWEFDGQFPFESVGGPLPFDYDAPTEFRLPVEAVEKDAIGVVAAGEVVTEGDFNFISTYSSLDRRLLEYELRQSIGVAIGGLLLGILAWRLLVHGLGGPVGRRRALVVGAALATPPLILPVVLAGTPLGVGIGFLFPAAAALVLGLAIAREHPDRAWVQTAMAGSAVAAGLAGVLVVRYITAPSLAPQDFGTILAVVAAIGIIPALIAAFARRQTVRQRASVTSLGMMPAAALTLIGPPRIETILPLILVCLLLGWQLLPIERAMALVSAGAGRVRSRSTGIAVPEPAPAQAVTRDLLAYLLIGGACFLSLASPVYGPVGAVYVDWAGLIVLGVGLGALVGFALRRGFLGAAWAEAAVPLAAAISVPIVLANTSYGGEQLAVATIPTALAALAVTHVLALRHTDPVWRTRLLLAAGVVAGAAAILAFGGSNLALPLLGLIALVPGVPVAFADVPGEPRAMTARLETMAVALTPGAAATMLVPSIGIVLLGAWLVALVVWRRFALAPLLGLAQRTQLQRDLAVAAAETERARLAADLHDDALQQLTMLVRTLDEGGQKDAADEAREIATKLRAVVGDLRLPILDDLGAGAALEWLVERVEPLAGGPVKLERSDETRPPANVELAIFRVAQEALTNAIKHGKPPIAVRYDVRADGRVTLAIDDAGIGIGDEAAEEAPRQGHFGLANMEQRAEQIGALLDVRRWPAGGTRVALEWRPQ